MATRQDRHRARIDAQRARRRRGRRRPGRRRAVVAAAVVAAAVALVAVVVAARPGDDGEARNAEDSAPRDRPGAPLVEGSPPVAIARTPTTWHIVYRLEEASGDRSNVSTDEVWVRRPFDSRLETKRGAPPGGEQASLQVGTFGSRTNTSAASQPLTLAVPPGTAPSDVRVAAVLPRALDAGLVERREVREVAGRRCQVYRSGGLFGEGVLRKPTPDRRADSCVDEAGLVLEEVLLRADGSVLSRRVAETVEEEVTVDPALFPSAAPTLEPGVGGGQVRRLVPGSRAPGEFLETDAPPSGFEHTGRFSVIPPQPENFRQDDPMAPDRRRAAVVDVWIRGPDHVTVEQGGTLRGAPPFTVDPSSPTIDLGTFGRGEVVLGGQGTSVRVLRGGGQYIAVAGTLDAEELAAVARSLRPVEGTPLQFADG